MRKKARIAGVVVGAAAAVSLMGGSALADITTSGDNGVLSGNQVVVPAPAPGNTTTSGNNGVLSGNQVVLGGLPALVAVPPIATCGTQVVVVGGTTTTTCAAAAPSTP